MKSLANIVQLTGQYHQQLAAAQLSITTLQAENRQQQELLKGMKHDAHNMQQQLNNLQHDKQQLVGNLEELQQQYQRISGENLVSLSLEQLTELANTLKKALHNIESRIVNLNMV